MNESDEALSEWRREVWRTGTEIEKAEHEERERLEREALRRVNRAREELGKAKKEFGEALEALTIRRRLRRDSWNRLEGGAGKYAGEQKGILSVLDSGNSASYGNPA
jgi:hypothetical protein